MLYLLLLTLLIPSVTSGPIADTTARIITSTLHPVNFICKDGTHIPLHWLCDNLDDCVDGEDEKDCHYLHDCPKGTYMCRSGECLAKQVKCNGAVECSDDTDERVCPRIVISSTSSTPHPDDFVCRNGTHISLDWVCDNINDCKDGEDEKDCQYLHDCQKNEFMCRSGECLSRKVKCNGYHECSDSSDERACPDIDYHTTTFAPSPSSSVSSASICQDGSEHGCSRKSYAVLAFIIILLLLTCLLCFIPLPAHLLYRRSLIINQITSLLRKKAPHTPKSIKKGPIISPASARMHPPNPSSSDVIAGFHNPIYGNTHTINSPLLMNHQ